MRGQTRGRCFFGRKMWFFAVFITGLVFSGCLDPVSDSDDSSPAPSSPSVPHFELDSPFINSSEDLISALADPNVAEIIVDSSVSLTIPKEVGVTVSALPESPAKTLKIPSTSMVTIHNLSVPAGATLKLEKEPQGSSGQIVQIVLGSFKIEAGAALSVGDNIRVTLNDSNTVGGIFRLGSTVIVDKGAEILGSDGGKIFIDDGVIVFIDKGNNNFYKKVGNDLYEKIEGSITNPPTGSFFWGSTGWMENVEYYPKNLEEFFKAEYSTTYTVVSSEPLPNVDFLKATDLPGEKILVLNHSVTGDALTLAAGAKLKLKGSGTLTGKKLVLEPGAELEVGTGVTFIANEGKNSTLKENSKIVVRGTFENSSMPEWIMAENAKFEFYEGSRVYIKESVPSTKTLLIGRAEDGIGATIALEKGTIVLHPDEFRLEGNAVLNSAFTPPWNGKIYIDGALDLKAKFTVTQPNPPPKPYFELVENARVNVKSGGELFMKEGPSAEGSVKYGKLGKGSSIVVEDGGTFRNKIFPNWEHEGSADSQGAFVFQAGAKVYAYTTAFGASNDNELLYITNSKVDGKDPVVNLAKGQIRLTDKTFALENGIANRGTATLNNIFTLSSGAKLVVKNSDLTIAGGAEFTLESTLTSEFVTLDNADITVGKNARFTINGPNPLPGGGEKLARLTNNSTITVESGGTFHNGIYPNWKMESAGKFVFESGSTVSIGDSSSPLAIIAPGSAPVKLEKGTITYADKEISLEGKAEMVALAVEQLWQGFELIVKQSSELVVYIDPKGGLQLDGISISTEGNGKVTYQTGK